MKQALAIVAASLGPEQFESAYQHWLSHWKPMMPTVRNMIDLMGEATEKLYVALADAGFDVLSRLGRRMGKPRGQSKACPPSIYHVGHSASRLCPRYADNPDQRCFI